MHKIWRRLSWMCLAAIGAAAPATAGIYTATFTGTLYGAANFAGLFGQPGTDISEQAFTAVYRVNTGVPGIVQFDARGRTGYLYSGEYYYAGLPTAMSVALTVNGHTQTIVGNYKGLIVQEDDVGPGYPRTGNGDVIFYGLDGYDHAQIYSSLSFTIADGTSDIVPTYDYTAPDHYRFVGTTAMDNRFSFTAYGSNQAYGSLHATNLVVRAGVPEPGAWLLMITGFGLVGTTLRVTRRASSLKPA